MSRGLWDSPFPGGSRLFRVDGFVRSALLEFVAYFLRRFLSRVAKLDVLSGISEGEGGVFGGDPLRLSGFQDKALFDFVVHKVFCFGSGFRCNEPASHIDRLPRSIHENEIFATSVFSGGIWNDLGDADFWRVVILNFYREAFLNIRSAVGVPK